MTDQANARLTERTAERIRGMLSEPGDAAYLGDLCRALGSSEDLTRESAALLVAQGHLREIASPSGRTAYEVLG
jgi:hypothetical protein